MHEIIKQYLYLKCTLRNWLANLSRGLKAVLVLRRMSAFFSFRAKLLLACPCNTSSGTASNACLEIRPGRSCKPRCNRYTVYRLV